ncbi:GNAT family N-acetyltransferase [Aspergillus alliaceus]|uniref:GNAT family N-acetyltransferase n=1 Tax=Petromyces alliaceus TaxID=209559 RepID=UPI0012A44BF5|nr:acyl-CoA N-acyltransferase [Aspergillus alliaceus]KAB8234248.1 acyl-CoA N-acyltransferase [Aspergillus alliaceus]
MAIIGPDTQSYRLEVREREWCHPDCEQLRQLQREEIATIYGRPDSEPGTPPSADDISVFIVVYLYRCDQPNSQLGASAKTPLPIACGGLRVIPLRNTAPGDVEVKRMYVHQEYRGKPWSAAKAILIALENKARKEGWNSIVLETGTLQKAAIKFYQREGYTPIPKFGAYAESELSLCFGKRLCR